MLCPAQAKRPEQGRLATQREFQAAMIGQHAWCDHPGARSAQRIKQGRYRSRGQPGVRVEDQDRTCPATLPDAPVDPPRISDIRGLHQLVIVAVEQNLDSTIRGSVVHNDDIRGDISECGGNRIKQIAYVPGAVVSDYDDVNF
jgi:hypothetical protein